MSEKDRECVRWACESGTERERETVRVQQEILPKAPHYTPCRSHEVRNTVDHIWSTISSGIRDFEGMEPLWDWCWHVPRLCLSSGWWMSFLRQVLWRKLTRQRGIFFALCSRYAMRQAIDQVLTPNQSPRVQASLCQIAGLKGSKPRLIRRCRKLVCYNLTIPHSPWQWWQAEALVFNLVNRC